MPLGCTPEQAAKMLQNDDRSVATLKAPADGSIMPVGEYHITCTLTDDTFQSASKVVVVRVLASVSAWSSNLVEYRAITAGPTAFAMQLATLATQATGKVSAISATVACSAFTDLHAAVPQRVATTTCASLRLPAAVLSIAAEGDATSTSQTVLAQPLQITSADRGLHEVTLDVRFAVESANGVQGGRLSRRLTGQAAARAAQSITQQVTMQHIVYMRVDSVPRLVLSVDGTTVISGEASSVSLNATVGGSLMLSAAESVDYESDGGIVSTDFALDDSARAALSRVHPGFASLKLLVPGRVTVRVTITDTAGYSVTKALVVTIMPSAESATGSGAAADNSDFSPSEGWLFGFVVLVVLFVGASLLAFMWWRKRNATKHTAKPRSPARPTESDEAPHAPLAPVITSPAGHDTDTAVDMTPRVQEEEEEELVEADDELATSGAASVSDADVEVGGLEDATEAAPSPQAVEAGGAE
jgi:hypothetical protein